MGKLDLCQNFRGFDICGVPYVYINREIQGMPVVGGQVSKEDFDPKAKKWIT